MYLVSALLLAAAALTHAQELADAIKPYSQLSQFGQLLAANPSLLPQSSGNQTILIPTDDAFAQYQAQTGTAVTTLGASTLAAIFQYHTLDGYVDSTALKTPKGLIAPTQLLGDAYNHRGNASIGGNKGQVVYISTSNNTIAVRQADVSGPMVKSGAGMEVTVNATDAVYSGGLFHPISGYVDRRDVERIMLTPDRFLSLPVTCTNTMKTNGLNSLLGALAQTNLSDTLNMVPGVTCLAPTDQAFAQAGNAPSTDALKSALLFHTIPMPIYTPELQDGQILMSASNQTIRVSITNGQLFYNDAHGHQLERADKQWPNSGVGQGTKPGGSFVKC